jgi:energy-coupling factor transporter ATP-binding protein EcfA2
MRYQSLAALRADHADLIKERRQGGVTPAFLEKVAALVRYGKQIGTLLDAHKDRQAAQSILDYWDHVLRRENYETVDPTLLEFDLSLAPELDDDQCPFLGLYAFQEENRSLFFGRQRIIDVLIDHLQTNCLLPVVGPSGSGKSSLILAGLLPQLKGGAIKESENWRYYPPFVPGSNPLAKLAGAIRPDGSDKDAWVEEQQAHLLADPAHLTRLIDEQQSTASGDEQATVLIIDQFEEAFTLCLDQKIRHAFIDNLTHLVQATGSKHMVILTMRTDFEPRMPQLTEFYPLFEQTLVRVTPLDAGELREAIERPAERVGLIFEDGVVKGLLEDVLGEPAALPLLQFTLLKLWENRQRNRITLDMYHNLGGGRLTLANSADELYESLIPQDQVTVRRILLHMVRPTEGLEVTSSRIRRDVLYQRSEARDRVDHVLDKLIEARLVRLTVGDESSDAQVEVAHEALVRNWPRLVGWIEDEREQMRRRLRLTTAAEQWQALDKDPSTLWRGRMLHEALELHDLNILEKQFLEAGKAAELADLKEKEEARQALILAEEQERRAWRQRAEEQARAATRLRWLTAALIISLLMTVVAALWALGQQRNALREAAIAVTAQYNADILRLEAQVAATDEAKRAQDLEDLNEALQVAVNRIENQPAFPTSVAALTPAAVTATEEIEEVVPGTSTASPTKPSASATPEQTATATATATAQTEPERPEIKATTIVRDADDFGPETIIIGSSVNDTDVEAVRLGSGPNRIIFIGGLHAGFAPGTVELAQQSIDHFLQNPDEIPADVTAFFIPLANPDSLAKGTGPGDGQGLTNANNVDLNRNWDCNWEQDTSFYDPLKGEGYHTQGSSESQGAFSEPETQALRDFIVANDPTAVVFWFAPWPGGLAKAGRCGPTSQVSGPLSLIYGSDAFYLVADFIDSDDKARPGQSINWLDAQGIPSIYVFLPDYTLSGADLANNLQGIKAVMMACQTGECIQ